MLFVLPALLAAAVAGTPYLAVPFARDRGSFSVPGRRPHDSSTCTGVGTDSFLGVTQFNAVAGANAAILGGNTNFVCDDDSAVASGEENVISSNGKDAAQSSFIGGGADGRISAALAFIGAGYENQTSAYASVIGGGYQNVVEPLQTGGARYGFIGAGLNNALYGEYAVIAGGAGNIANGRYATIPGGYHNVAAGELSFAGGYESDAATAGSFVWSDYSPGAPRLIASAPNQFLVRATGGVALFSNAAQTAGVSLAPGSGTWSSLSDRHVKTHVTGVDDGGILAKVAALPVSEWSYVSERGVRHIGPMAQDFYAAFQVGEDNRHIATIDEDGVALAAVKALHARAERLTGRVGTLERELTRVERELAALRRR
jgi:hypothetical protein